MNLRLRLKVKSQHLSVMPKVVCCRQETMLTISPLSDHARFTPGETVFIRLLPVNQRPFTAQGEPDVYPPFAVTASAEGTLSFPVFCEAEQQYSIQLYFDNSGKQQLLCTLSFFAAEEDLYRRRPFKGDTHVHTTGSDGRESPAAVIAAYRRAGFDFMAITDHRDYTPSLEGIARTENIPFDMSVFPGEEVHVPEDFFHVVNFGGSFSVNQYYYDNKEQVDALLRAEILAFDDASCPDKREYIFRRWLARKIQEGGGLAIFVHPHWTTCDVCCTSDAMTEYVFRKGDYDAFELLNGMRIHSNNLQTAFYFEQTAKGIHIPVVGASDSHGTWEKDYHFEEQYTILFAYDRDFDGVKEAVQNYYSVAVEENHGEHFRVYGDYRLVRYAIFLAQEYFPLYTQLCREQGEALLRVLQSNSPEEKAEDLALLRLLEGRTDRFAARCFGREQEEK